ncbi:hypothetical protein [Bacillus toyonensis]|nr:hypothetical protein [Bacillus toyonensis]
MNLLLAYGLTRMETEQIETLIDYMNWHYKSLKKKLGILMKD